MKHVPGCFGCETLLVCPRHGGLNRIALLIVALFALACAPVDRAVAAAPGLEADTLIAVNAWNDALSEACPTVRLTYVDAMGDADVTVAWGVAAGHEADAASETDGAIVVRPDLYEVWENAPTAAIIAHELGHAMGATHTNNAGDLMRGSPLSSKRSPAPSAGDVFQVCRTVGAK